MVSNVRQGGGKVVLKGRWRVKGLTPTRQVTTTMSGKHGTLVE